MSWVITGSQPFPAVIGEPFGGGYFAGYISHTADGNPTHALIVAPKATGETNSIQWATNTSTTTSATSLFDGVLNTSAIVTSGIVNHPAAQFCVNLSIGGYTDWYLPSTLELDIAYFNLKPTTTSNATNFGSNAYAVPLRASNNSSSYPAQTSIPLFAFPASEAFITNPQMWSSTEFSADIAYRNDFNNGSRLASAFGAKTTTLAVRAFRRIAL